MISVVVPAKNEEVTIATVIKNINLIKPDYIILVASGCTDNTINEAKKLNFDNLKIVEFADALGNNVPRSIGAKIALELNSEVTIFVDGDLTGDINKELGPLVEMVKNQGVDFAIRGYTCLYPKHIKAMGIFGILKAQIANRLGLWDKIGVASTSAVPFAVSKKFLETIPLREMSIPPVALVLAARAGLSIDVNKNIVEIVNRHRGGGHEEKMFETVIGDLVEALSILEGKERTREYQGEFYIGYHTERCFDLLD